MIVWLPVPTAVGVYVTLQAALAGPRETEVARLQGEPRKAPEESLMNETVPVGAMMPTPGPSFEEIGSTTVAVHVVGEFTAEDVG